MVLSKILNNKTATLIAITLLVTGAAVTATNLVTGDSQPDGYELNITTQTTTDIKPTEATFNANLTNLDPIYDSAIVYWNVSTGTTEKTTAMRLVNQTGEISQLGTGLNPGLTYDTKAYVEPYIVDDSKLAKNFHQRMNQSENFNDTTLSVLYDYRSIDNKTYLGETDYGDYPFAEFSTNGKYMYAASGYSEMVRLKLDEPWNPNEGYTTGSTSSLPNEATGITFSTNGKYMYTVRDDTNINDAYRYKLNTAWKPSDGRTGTELDGYWLEDSNDLDFSPNGKYMYVGDEFGLDAYKLEDPWKPENGLTDVGRIDSNVGGVEISSNGEYVYQLDIASNEAISYSLNTPWKLNEGFTEIERIQVEYDGVLSVSTDGQYLNVGQDFDGKRKTYRLGDG